MREELQLKEISKYLPYDVKIIGNTHGQIEILSTVTETSVNIKGRGTTYGMWADLQDIKLVLRPMSDFDKVENDFDLSTDFEGCFLGSSKELYSLNTSDKTYLSDMLTVTEFLFENHFDVFGLIEKGLAIDIKTLNK